MTDIKVISFDLDDTLYDNGPVIHNAFIALYNFLCAHYPKVADHFDFDGFLKNAHQIKHEHQEIVDLHKLRHLHINTILTSSGYPKVATDPAYQVFIKARQQVDLYPVGLEILKHLKKHYKIISISNGNADPNQIGLGDFIEQSFNPANTGFAKPDPRIYSHCCDQLNIAPQQMLHIGDCLNNDFYAAQEASCKALWLNLNNSDSPEQPQFNSLILLKEYLNDSLIP